MHLLKISTTVEQVAEHFKKSVVAGLWRGEMPGVVALAEELGANHKAVEAALGSTMKRPMHVLSVTWSRNPG